jgi:hypothetical protein
MVGNRCLEASRQCQDQNAYYKTSIWLKSHFTGTHALGFSVSYYYYYYYYYYWGETESTWYCGHYWPIVPAPNDIWWWLWSRGWNEDWQGKPKYSEKTCPSATYSTTNPSWPNPGRRDGKPATNRLSYGAAYSVFPSRILAKDLARSHFHFNSHMKSSWHRLFLFLPFFLNHLRLSSTELDPFHFFSTNVLYCRVFWVRPFITPRHEQHRKHSQYC